MSTTIKTVEELKQHFRNLGFSDPEIPGVALILKTIRDSDRTKGVHYMRFPSGIRHLVDRLVSTGLIRKEKQGDLFIA